MKKMLLMAAVSVFALTACSEDENDDNNGGGNDDKLVGVWTSQSVALSSIMNDTIVFMDTTIATAGGSWEFTADNMLISSVNAGEPNPFGMFTNDTMYYTHSNNMLTVKEDMNAHDSTADVVNIETLTDTQLVIGQTETETDTLGNTTEGSLTLTFTK